MSNGFLELELLGKEKARADQMLVWTWICAAGTDKQKKILCEFRDHYSFIRRRDNVHVIDHIVAKNSYNCDKNQYNFNSI